MRRFAVRVFGPLFYRVRRRFAVWALVMGVGWGLTAHDLWVEICNPPSNPYRVHGGYIGLILIVIGYVLTLREFGQLE